MRYLRAVAVGIVLFALLVGSVWATSPSPAPAHSTSAARSTRTAARPVAPEVPSVSDNLRRARVTLARFQATYRHLDGVTVTEGTPPEGNQAIAYYTTGEIVISPTHEASTEDIIAHEVWHVIDWRDNGRIDWGEALPPADASDYLK